MSRLLFGIALVLTILIQATLLPRVNPYPISPDIALVMLIFFMARHRITESLSWIFVAGLLMDVLAMDRLGVHALAMIPIVVLAVPLTTRPWRFDILTVMALTAAGSLMYGVLLTLLRQSSFGLPLLIQVGMQLAVCPVLYVVFRIFARRHARVRT